MHRRSKRTLSALRRNAQVRGAATATKPAPGKWGAPQASLAPSTSTASKWARPPPPPRPSNTQSQQNIRSGQDSGPSGVSWANRSQNSSQTTTSSSSRPASAAAPSPFKEALSSIIKSSSSPSPGLSKWSLPSGPSTSNAPSTSTIPKWAFPDRPGRASTTSSSTATQLDRDKAPHLVSSVQRRDQFRNGEFNRDRRDRPLSRDGDSRNNVWRDQDSRYSQPSTSRRPAERGEGRTSRAAEDSKSNGRKTAVADEDDVVVADSVDLTPEEHRGRRGKMLFKERGSLARHVGEDVVIPAHRRLSHEAQGTHPPKVTRPKKAFKPKQVKRDLFIPSMVSVGNFAKLLKVPLNRLQWKMREAGMGEDAAAEHILTSDYAALLAEEFNRNPVINDAAAFDIYPAPPHPEPSTLPARPPIVTIMGHVDHGKTTLLDTLRSASVASGEAGGITQHIGAFSVPVPSTAGGDGKRTITFLDTPGHAAFSAMRARGASVTDIVVLVVAADDGVMPQTKEVIELAKKDADKVQLVVAINKVDKPGADIEKVVNALLVEGIHLESIGGEVPSVEVSGLTGQGLDQLVETISAVAEMQDLRAEHDLPAHGWVLESKVQKGLGPVATVLVSRGTLKPAAHIICGTTFARVRVMTDSAGKPVKAALPGMAVTVSGWKDVPSAGDEVLQGSESDIKKAVANRERKAEEDATMVDLEAINDQRREERERRELEAEASATGEDISADLLDAKPDGPKELRLIIKGDVSGSVEAVEGAVQGIGNKIACVKIVATGVGEVSESDVLRAKACQAMIVAFSVPVPRPVQASAGQNSVPIYSSPIIYQVMDEVKKRVCDLLPSVYERKVTGEAKVAQIFDIHLSGKRIKKVAGGRISNGVLEKSKGVQVIRNGEVVHSGRLETFRHLKNDITTASKGLECGMALENFDDLRPEDLIQCYDNIEKPKTLY